MAPMLSTEKDTPVKLRFIHSNRIERRVIEDVGRILVKI